jgi:hypothetical protein
MRQLQAEVKRLKNDLDTTNATCASELEAGSQRLVGHLICKSGVSSTVHRLYSNLFHQYMAYLQRKVKEECAMELEASNEQMVWESDISKHDFHS